MLEDYIAERKSVRRAIMRLTDDPSSSQSVSSANGGSISYSYLDIEKLYRRDKELASLIAELYRASKGAGGIGISYPIYCGG